MSEWKTSVKMVYAQRIVSQLMGICYTLIY